jgi:hypothetical protein
MAPLKDIKKEIVMQDIEKSISRLPIEEQIKALQELRWRIILREARKDNERSDSTAS